ncbi:MAG: hypothetical protein NTY74_09140 [Ignavibacteriae bacterium]|nr:hypothetical protein [Ignavibacteriota bacterium]
MLSTDNNVSSNRIAFLLIIFCVLTLVFFYSLIAIKGVVWNLPVTEILDKMNFLIIGILGSGVVTKQLGKYLEQKKEE